MTDQQFICYMIVNTLVAIGTIGAVLVALFQTFRVKLWPPNLVFSVVDEFGELTYYSDNTPTSPRPVRYYHLRIQNTRRWSPASDLGVHLIRIEGPEVLGEGLLQAWYGDVPIRCRHQELYPLRRSIGSAIDYDLCSISNAASVSKLSLLPIITPMNLAKDWVTKTHLVASFQAKASDCDSRIVRVEMAWDGQWEAGNAEMHKHFKLRILDS